MKTIQIVHHHGDRVPGARITVTDASAADLIARGHAKKASRVRFLKAWESYNANEVAVFLYDQAIQMFHAGVVELLADEPDPVIKQFPSPADKMIRGHRTKGPGDEAA